MSEQGMRPSIMWMKEHFKGKAVVGVELGVFKGTNAMRLISELNIKQLSLVDTWETPSYWKGEMSFEQNYEFVKETYKAMKKVFIHRMDTVKASNIVADETLDFVYIDGDHSYEGCRRDIEAWYPKVKKGGVIVGHDYYKCIGVLQSFNELISRENPVFWVFDAIGIYDKVKYGEVVVIK